MHCLSLQLYQIHKKSSSSPLWAPFCAGMSTYLLKISKWTQQHIILFLPSTLIGRYLQLLFLDHDTEGYLFMMILKFLLCLSTKTEEMALLTLLLFFYLQLKIYRFCSLLQDKNFTLLSESYPLWMSARFVNTLHFQNIYPAWNSFTGVILSQER